MADSPFPYDKVAFGRELKRRRIAKGWSQAELGRRAGKISEHAISSYERGARAPEWGSVADLARAFEVTSEELLKGVLLRQEAKDDPRHDEVIASPEPGREGPLHKPDGKEAAPRNELFERVLRACELTEKANRYEVEPLPHTIPPPFGQMAEIRFRARATRPMHSPTEGAYGLVALAKAPDESELQILSTALRARGLVWGSLVHKGPAAPERTVSRDGVSIRVVGLDQFEEELINLRPHVRRQTELLASDSLYDRDRYVSQRLRWSVGLDVEREAPDALAEVQSWISIPGPRFVLILGDFGTGKTFLLHELARRLGEEDGALVPILIKMRDLEKARSLDVLFAQHLAASGMDMIHLEAFRHLLSEGKIALLFDGYDELALRVTFERAAEHLGTLLQAAIGNSKVVLTSRTQHFQSDKQVKLALLDLIEGMLMAPPIRRFLALAS